MSRCHNCVPISITRISSVTVIMIAFWAIHWTQERNERVNVIRNMWLTCWRSFECFQPCINFVLGLARRWPNNLNGLKNLRARVPVRLCAHHLMAPIILQTPTPSSAGQKGIKSRILGLWTVLSCAQLLSRTLGTKYWRRVFTRFSLTVFYVFANCDVRWKVGQVGC